MAVATLLILSLAVNVADAVGGGLRARGPYADKCPFGYGKGCGGGGGTISPATKAQVANILKGMIKNLGGGHRNLMQVSKDVSSSFAINDAKNADVRRALGLLSAQYSNGLVSHLVGAKVEDSATVSVSAVLKDMLKACPFGYGDGCGGGGEIDPATKAQVANILKGMISSLSGGHRNLMQVSQDVATNFGINDAKNAGVKKALLGLLSTPIDPATKEEVANILKGMIANLSKGHRSLGLVKVEDCPFGYGCGGGGSISPATKAQVANILKGMIKNLSGGHRNLVQVPKDPKMQMALAGLVTTMVRVGKDSTALLSQLVGSKVADSTSDSVSAVLKDMLKGKDCPFGYGTGCHGVDSDEMPIDPATKDEVANILKGMIKNLSGH